jgi:hypothetical protein
MGGIDSRSLNGCRRAEVQKKGQVFPALKTSPSSSRGYEEFDPIYQLAKEVPHITF